MAPMALTWNQVPDVEARQGKQEVQGQRKYLGEAPLHNDVTHPGLAAGDVEEYGAAPVVHLLGEGDGVVRGAYEDGDAASYVALGERLARLVVPRDDGAEDRLVHQLHHLAVYNVGVTAPHSKH